MSEYYPMILVLEILAIAAGLIVSWMVSESWQSYKKWRREKEATEMSQYGIRLPAPKLDMPPDDARNHARYITQFITGESPSRYASLDEFERDLFRKMEVWHRHWRIERSRADDLERMVEQLEMENRRLRKPLILSLFKRKQ